MIQRTNGRWRGRAAVKTTACVLCAVGVLGVLAIQAQPARRDAPGRTSERLRALEREAADLATRERTLLAELRKLEIERQIRSEELTAIQQDLGSTERALGAITAREEELRAALNVSRPDVEQRLVRLYKMGRAGYWRLLLDVDDATSVGRAYRTASTMLRMDRDSVTGYQRTLKALEAERAALEARAREFSALQARAAAAQAASERAVTAHRTLLESVAARQDLAAQLAAELREAQERLNRAVAAGGAAAAGLPFASGRGSVPWPADGIVIGRFGPYRGADGALTSRNGIELSLPEGRDVTAVHEGVVTYAAPFAGYGQLVIVAHGGTAHTLYGHLASISVVQGERVAEGTRLGRTGRNPAGNPALYFELRIDGQPVDPLQWLRRRP